MIIIRNVRPREKIRKDIQLFLLNVQPSVLTQDLFILLYSASLFIILWCNSSSIKRGQACFSIYQLIWHAIFKFQVCNFIANFNEAEHNNNLTFL